MITGRVVGLRDIECEIPKNHIMDPILLQDLHHIGDLFGTGVIRSCNKIDFRRVSESQSQTYERSPKEELRRTGSSGNPTILVVHNGIEKCGTSGREIKISSPVALPTGRLGDCQNQTGHPKQSQYRLL